MGIPVVAERLAEARRRGAAEAPACVLLLLNGGPSPYETFDPKPAAPREIRGPLRAISTAVPGVAFCECLPQLAARADRLTVVRSLFHSAAPIHETGLQLLQGGRLVRKGSTWSSLGTRVSQAASAAEEVPPYVLLNGGLCGTGTSASVGDAGLQYSIAPGPVVVDSTGQNRSLAETEPQVFTDLACESAWTRDRYGDSPVGQLLLQTRQLVEQGVRFVTVNMFHRLHGERTWDAHGCPESAPATLFDYQHTLGPQLDRAVAALLDDLTDRGLLRSTLLVCAGELGRSPVVNAAAGRDHWTTGFSALLAGGDSPAGVVLGATTPHGGEISDAPLALEELAARMATFIGLTAPELA